MDRRSARFNLAADSSIALCSPSTVVRSFLCDRDRRECAVVRGDLPRTAALSGPFLLATQCDAFPATVRPSATGLVLRPNPDWRHVTGNNFAGCLSLSP